MRGLEDKAVWHQAVETATGTFVTDEVASRRVRLRFETPSHFGTAFRRMTGITPSVYRSGRRHER